MEKKVVLHFVHTLHGGVASVAANLMKYQYDLGYKIVLIYVVDDDSFNLLIPFKYEKVKINIPKYPGASMLFGMNVNKLFRKYKKKYSSSKVIVHIHNVQTLGLLSKIRNIPMICTLHSLNGEEKSLRRMISEIIYGLILKKLLYFQKDIVAVSHAIANHYSKFTGKEKIHVIHNGVSVDSKVVNKSNKKFIIGHIGNISEAKGWDKVFNAYCMLPDRYKNSINFISAGKTTSISQNKINDLIIKNNVVGRVEYRGYIENASSLLIPELDLLILASRNEGLGMVLIEAQAHGIPILGTNTGGIVEVIENEYNGFIIEDSLDICNKIIKIYDNPELRKRLRENSLKTYQAKFTLKKMGSSYEKLYLGQLKRYK